MNRYSLVLFILSLLLIMSCDNKPSFTELCQDNKEICLEFGEDSWCKTERNAISLAKITLVSNPPSATEKDKNPQKYRLLVSYEDYIDCMSLASQIQHIKLKEKTVRRTNNLLMAKAKLSELAEETADSTHPHLLYYHWTRRSDEQALAKFLQLEGSDLLENSTAQYHLATYYVKRDINKTLALLFHSLELHQPGSTLEAEVLQTLATIFTNKEKYKQAYIWLKAYQLVNDEKNNDLVGKLSLYQQNHKLDSGFLDKVAINTLKNIRLGKFTSPRF